MDEEHYRAARDSVDHPRCAYELAIQQGYFTCQHKSVMQLGEREALYCTDVYANRDCQKFNTLCIGHSGFALGKVHLPRHLPFGKTAKVQIGGLQGVAAMLNKNEQSSSKRSVSALLDVANLLKQLKSQCDGFEKINFSQIMTSIAKFDLRKSRGRKAQD